MTNAAVVILIALTGAAACGDDQNGDDSTNDADDTDDTDDTDDADGSIDAAPAAPTVTITNPRLDASFYPTDMVPILWSTQDADSASLSCRVVATTGTTEIEVAIEPAIMPGVQNRTMWTPGATAPSAANYQVTIVCTDAGALTGTATSPAFEVAPPADVTYAMVQAVFMRCSTALCHDANGPAGGLNLTQSSIYANIVNVESDDCDPTLLVKPGVPSESYLFHKLSGGGPCFEGTKMPRGYNLTPAQIKQVRDWIAVGAPNN